MIRKIVICGPRESGKTRFVDSLPGKRSTLFEGRFSPTEGNMESDVVRIDLDESYPIVNREKAEAMLAGPMTIDRLGKYPIEMEFKGIIIAETRHPTRAKALKERGWFVMHIQHGYN